MKYTSTDRLCDFEFHDAEITLDVHNNGWLSLWADYLNIHCDAEQNPFDTDMEIDRAYISFKNFNLLSYKPGRAWKQNENGEFYTDEAEVIYRSDDALKLFLSQLNDNVCVLDLGQYEDDVYYIDGCGSDPFFSVFFTFDSVTIEWDYCTKQAWYIRDKKQVTKC